jgi:hypothetical protein
MNPLPAKRENKQWNVIWHQQQRWEWSAEPVPENRGGARSQISALNSQWSNAGKAAKDENGGRTTTQPPRGATSTQQRLEKHKGLEWRWCDRPTAQTGQVEDSGADLWDRRQHSKLNSPTLLGEELTKQSWQCYLTSQFPLLLWTEGTNTTHQTYTW